MIDGLKPLKLNLRPLFILLIGCVTASAFAADAGDDAKWGEWLSEDLFDEANLVDPDELQLNALDKSDVYRNQPQTSASQEDGQEWLEQLWHLENSQWGQIDKMSPEQLQSYQQWLAQRLEAFDQDTRSTFINHPENPFDVDDFKSAFEEDRSEFNQGFNQEFDKDFDKEFNQEFDQIFDDSPQFDEPFEGSQDDIEYVYDHDKSFEENFEIHKNKIKSSF